MTGRAIYAVGTVGVDFGTESRRDGFTEEFHRSHRGSPEDSRQLGSYLRSNPWAVDQLVWTLTMDGRPVYALEPDPSGIADLRGQFTGHAVHGLLIEAVAGHATIADAERHVSVVSLAGLMTNRSARLISGAVLPVVEVAANQIDMWFDNLIVNSTVEAFQLDERFASADPGTDLREVMSRVVRSVVETTLAAVRNRGESPADRALNFLGTSLVYSTRFLSESIAADGEHRDLHAEPRLYALSHIATSKSPIERPGSDCWDVTLTFFDASEPHRARMCYVFRVDVSDTMPVLCSGHYAFLSGATRLRREPLWDNEYSTIL